MRKLPWAALGLLAAAAMANVVFVGCGSEDDPITDTSDAGDANVGNDTGVITPPADSGTDGFITTIDGGRADAADCKLVAQTCATSADCCSVNCNTTTKQCEAPLIKCAAPGAACATGVECCTLSCTGGTCSNKQCVADNLACAVDGECCGGKCAPDGVGGGKCAPLNGGGPKTDGNPCVSGADCASKYCNGGICTSVSFCQQASDICSADYQCCSGNCAKAAGATVGICQPTKASGAGAGTCEQSGTVCTPASPTGACGGSCCTKSCAPYGATATSVCQPASGCHVEGDLCRANSDCCGWAGSPQPLDKPFVCVKDSTTQEFGLCGKGGSCNEPGSICGKALETGGGIAVCSAANNCCEVVTQADPQICNSSPENCCRRDALGVPRCILDKHLDCATAVITAATKCVTSADCCNKPCIGGFCGTTCVPSGGTCTANADCCAGLPCAIAPGSTSGICGGTTLPDGGVAPPPPDGGVIITQDGGTAGDGGVCALYGQACMVDSNCCGLASGVKCIGVAGSATCRFP